MEFVNQDMNKEKKQQMEVYQTNEIKLMIIKTLVY